LFEAVVNSIHGIEEAKCADGVIRVEILRKAKHGGLGLDDTKKRGPEALGEIVGFRVTDNGIGFNDANMESFQTLDTEHKVSKGCRGVGRLLWLKAFKNVHVESVFEEAQGKLHKRTFDFNESGGVAKESNRELATKQPRETSVLLDDFRKIFRDHARKTLEAISECILEHCLWYFVRPGGAPRITIWDDGEEISLDDRYDAQMHASAVTETVVLNAVKFDLIHVKLRSNSLSSHAVAFCADNRLVIEEPLAGKIPGLHGRITDSKGSFVYMCYVSSPFLDEHARPERTGFDIPETVDELFAKTEISLPQIRSTITDQAAKHLKEYISENLKRSEERIERFVSVEAPRYRPILARIPKSSLNFDPEISDKDLDLALHKQLFVIERELLEEGHEIMAPRSNEQTDEYRRRLGDYLSKAKDIKMSDLANYVSHRKVILDLLEMAIQRNADGDYAREDIIHDLIMPMKQTSADLFADSCNLWLLDERLAFHDYLASDKTLASMPVTGSTSTKEPDVCALNVFDNPILVSEGSALPLATITVVEIKRPMRNDAAAGEVDDPVEQAMNYLNLIREGKAQTPKGRPIPDSEHIPGFCYILADITPKLKKRCLVHHDLKWTHDKMGFFGYKEYCNAYVEVISFERLVQSAKQRNRAFFDKLGLPAGSRPNT
jgi:hypothetical protein